jgi:hypothetical protein
MAGGIDAEKGYSRRVLSYMKYDTELDKQRIPTPDYKHFIAGNIGKKQQEEEATTNYSSLVRNPRAMAMSLPPPPQLSSSPPTLTSSSSEKESKTDDMQRRRRIIVISVCVGLIFFILWKMFKSIIPKR